MKTITEKTSQQTAPYDAAEFLESEEGIAGLNAALEDGDPTLVTATLGYKLDMEPASSL